MKKRQRKVLPFPAPKQPAPTTIVCQIGNERFAIHFAIEDLPPPAPLLVLKLPPRKKKSVK